MSKKRAVLWVAATILGPLLLYWFTSGWYIGIWFARTGHQGPPTAEVMIEAMFIGLPPALWAAVALWWQIHRKKASFGGLFSTRTRAVGMDVSLGLGLGVVWVLAYGLLDVVSWQKMSAFNLSKLASVPASLSAGFCEEFLYRGFLFWLLAAAAWRKRTQLVVSSIAFGLAHCFWGPYGMLWTTILGLTLGLAVLWRGSVWPAVVAHTLLDLCIEPGLIEKALSGRFH
jgi:membrane protease YdiL (CAAX protease family)